MSEETIIEYTRAGIKGVFVESRTYQSPSPEGQGTIRTTLHYLTTDDGYEQEYSSYKEAKAAADALVKEKTGK